MLTPTHRNAARKPSQDRADPDSHDSGTDPDSPAQDGSAARSSQAHPTPAVPDQSKLALPDQSELGLTFSGPCAWVWDNTRNKSFSPPTHAETNDRVRHEKSRVV